jgi:hypothetical protein
MNAPARSSRPTVYASKAIRKAVHLSQCPYEGAVPGSWTLRAPRPATLPRLRLYPLSVASSAYETQSTHPRPPGRPVRQAVPAVRRIRVLAGSTHRFLAYFVAMMDLIGRGARYLLAGTVSSRRFAGPDSRESPPARCPGATWPPRARNRLPVRSPVSWRMANLLVDTYR